MGFVGKMKKSPLFSPWVKRIQAELARVAYPGTTDYWERRYSRGGTTGIGSFGALAEFKAEILNTFVTEQKIQSVIEFGCGDGNQLALADYPRYIGLDVSKTAIKKCTERFRGDEAKEFFLYEPERFSETAFLPKCDLALSLDVVYHLIEDESFETYLAHLFSSAEQFVIIYSSNTDVNSPLQSPHIRHRRFTRWIKRHHRDWAHVRTIKNRYPQTGNKKSGSFSDFHIFEKKPSE